ncbi:MAG TPA: hypothetical protein PKM41_06765 [Deltaproteobacteria bacterium]|jgi:hypothetical protein|nr:hypothetical protein [Deltaproteobacteria bacterium]HOI06811.1 hypothetical protein [Deltaproteobacteria bacterium]
MQKIPIGLAAPGMVLAKPILNEKGMPLCAEGTELTEMLIDRLRAMNVTILTVKGHPIDTGDREKTLEERLAEIEDRFIRVKGDPIMDEVKDAIMRAVRKEAAEREAMEAREGSS